MTATAQQVEAPLWDNGKAFFELLNEDLVSWDGRDCFYLESTAKLVERLSELDPTNFVAQSYVAALMKSCMHAVNFDLGRILYDAKVQNWVKSFKALKESTESAYLPHLNGFLDSVKAKVSHMEVDLNIDHVDMALLLRDALCATDMRLDWVYAYAGEPMSVNTFSTKLYRYPSIKTLELDIINNVLPFGCHIVGVDIVKGRNDADVSNFIVCNTPNRAFMISNIYFAFSQNEMQSSPQNQSSYHKYSEARTHFPNWRNHEQLPVPHGENKYQWSDISCLEPKQALWTLMTMELASIMVSQVAPKQLSASVALLDYKNEAGAQLPAVWIPPFELNHMSMAELIEDAGINQDPNKAWLLEVLEGVTTDMLLPEAPMLGFSLVTSEAFEEMAPCVTNSGAGLNKHGNPSSRENHRESCINLYPKPSNSYGNDSQVTESLNKILIENFQRVLMGKRSIDWDSHIEDTKKWFERALKRKFDNVLACYEENKTYDNFKPKGYPMYFNPQIGNTSPYMRYKICHRVDADNDPSRMMAMSALRIGEWSTPLKKYKGFKTKKGKCEEFIVCPMDWKDLCKLLDCKRSSLPKPLRNWYRTADAPWCTRGLGAPLMAHVFV